jgi:proline dehydrogenase
VIARQPGDRRNYLMLDMEDLGQLEPTLRLHAHLAGTRLPAAVTLQSRLHRTAQDLRGLVEQPAAVRLVKGAFPLGPEHDHTGRADISASYLGLAEMMLSKAARDAGFYPVFGTHDDALAEQLIESAHRNGWEPEQYEFEMLYGVRPDWQQALRARGIQVRAYVPFGEDWWPYAVRRVGENPRNARLMARAVAGGHIAGPETEPP